MDRIKQFFVERDLFAKHCGIELVEVGKGTAKTRMRVQEHHLNGVRSVQGGAIFTLADLAFAAACNSHGTVAVAINVSITFIKATSSGTLTAEAKEVSMNPKLGTYSIQITNDAGEVVATFQGLAYRKKESLDSALAGK
jgi:acyl-CoA thioesterase